MGRMVLVYGKSGSGKSRSLKNFAEDEILFINVEGKDLPFRNRFKYKMTSDNYEAIKAQLSKMPLKTAVIDDAGYLMTNEFMRGHRNNRGNAVYELYNDIADHFWGLIRHIKDALPEDVIVYMIMHEDSNDFGETTLKTIGKLLDDKVNVPGMVTIALRCMSEDGKHFFLTNTDGRDITKSPEDLFESDKIDNDLKAVDTAIREYYGLTPTQEETKNESN